MVSLNTDDVGTDVDKTTGKDGKKGLMFIQSAASPAPGLDWEDALDTLLRGIAMDSVETKVVACPEFYHYTLSIQGPEMALHLVYMKLLAVGWTLQDPPEIYNPYPPLIWDKIPPVSIGMPYRSEKYDGKWGDRG